ncbi:MAG: ATP-binding protein, partial [Thermoplasmata archaeon]|nr:ATP-binding protein [Thermoplasmata archaeon]
SLYIVISHDSDKIRYFANNLGGYLFRNRRLKGLISPLVLFIFDEADQFIPGKPRFKSEELSKSVIETLTRRGRKFGIGVGIATQRSAYLDTNIMGQLHTYFISKLPRKYDRDVVGEAFSLSPEQFTQTFKFQKGQWLLVSHEATGIDMPIPIQAPNAEDRIKEFINNMVLKYESE